MSEYDFNLDDFMAARGGWPVTTGPSPTPFEEMMARVGTYTRRERVQRWIAYAFWTVVQRTYYWVMHPWWHRRRTPSWVINRPHRAMVRWKNTRIRRGTITVKGFYGGRDV